MNTTSLLGIRMEPAADENMTQQVSPSLINELLDRTHYSIEQIAKECRISLKVLNRIRYGHPATTRSEVFKKILQFYCYVCYGVDGKKNRNTQHN